MRHARNRSTPDSRLTVAAALGALAIALAGCASTAAAPEPTVAPVTSVVDTAEPTVVTTVPPTPASQVPAAPAAATPPAVPGVFESPLYGYTIGLPAGSEVTGVKPATTPWDGTSAIGSTGPMVDQFPRTGQRLAFILAAPTDLDLDAWAAAVHARAVREHGCAEEFTGTRDFEIDGTPARVVAFSCQGLVVYEATTVRDGTGLIAKQITPPPGSPALAKASLDDFMWFLEPLTWAK